MTDLGEIFTICCLITEADLSVQHYILHLSNVKERSKNEENKYVIDLLLAITGISIEVNKNGRVIFKTGEKEEEKEKVKLSDVSLKEITSILLSLIDVQTPT